MVKLLDYEDVKILEGIFDKLGIYDYEFQYLNKTWGLTNLQTDVCIKNFQDTINILFTNHSTKIRVNDCKLSNIEYEYLKKHSNKIGIPYYSLYFELKSAIAPVLSKYNSELLETIEKNGEKTKGFNLYHGNEFIINILVNDDSDEIESDIIRIHGYITDDNKVAAEHFYIDSNERYLSALQYKVISEVLLAITSKCK